MDPGFAIAGPTCGIFPISHATDFRGWNCGARGGQRQIDRNLSAASHLHTLRAVEEPRSPRCECVIPWSQIDLTALELMRLRLVVALISDGRSTRRTRDTN